MVKIYKLKLTVLQQEILRYLFIKAGNSFNARGLARAVEVSQPAISKALPLLEKEGYLKVEKDKESKRLSITLNRDTPLVTGLKRAENLKMIYESGLIDYLEEKFPGITIILFGSYSRGDDTEKSDIDIAIIGKEKRIDLEVYEKLLEKTIFLHFYDSLNKIDKNLRSNILRGITLIGVAEI